VTLAVTERLIAALVAHPEGLQRASAAAVCDAGLDAVLAELVRRGFPVRATSDRLVLDGAAAHFDPAEFERQRRTRLGAPLEVWESATSTNDLARAAADAGAPHGAAWLAESQTRGRGRQGRDWICAPHAGLLVSCVLHLSLQSPAQPLWLPLALGLGTCEALRAEGIPAHTKWPNDIVIGAAKVAGLLIETRFAPASATIFGLGVNVHSNAVAVEAGIAAASLGPVVRAGLLARLFAGIETRLEDWCAGRYSALHQAWLEHDCVPGKVLRAVTPDGTFRARARTVTDAGLLDLELEDGTRRQLAAGEVHLG